MKINLLKFVAAGAALAVCAGCIVMSVYPFYTAKDLIVDPSLEGRWVKGNNTNEIWQFIAAPNKSYIFTATDADETNCFEAHLFQLKQYQFLDLLATNRSEYQMPVHLISKVTHHNSSLSLQFLDYGWLTGLISNNPAALRHLIVPAEPGNAETNSDSMLFLTDETKVLQKFLLKHAEDTNAFNNAMTANRAPQ